jgi:uncharacterized phage infection (PIP) family protein YhgE
VILLNNIDNEREKWKKQKLMGKRKLILIHGVLLCCGSIVYSVLIIFFNPNPRNYDVTGIFSRFIFNSIIFGLCGILGGYINWNSKVRKFDN